MELNSKLLKRSGNALISSELVTIPEMESEDTSVPTIIVRRMTIGDNLRFISLIKGIDENDETRGYLYMVAKIMSCCVDSDGNYAFPDDDDLDLILMTLEATTIHKISTVADRLNPPITLEDIDKKK